MNQINLVCKKLMDANGFIFKRGGWYRLTNSFIFIVYFQRSLYSDLYYLCLGVELNTDYWASFPKGYTFPQECNFSIRHRVDDKEKLLTINDISSEKETQIQSFVLHSLQFFKHFTSISGFVDACINGQITVFPYADFFSRLGEINEKEAKRLHDWEIEVINRGKRGIK